LKLFGFLQCKDVRTYRDYQDLPSGRRPMWWNPSESTAVLWTLDAHFKGLPGVEWMEKY
jgi:hypothetical protein